MKDRINVNELSASERERKVWEISRQYARGEIPVEKFEEEERKYTPDYASAMFAIGKSRRDKNSDGIDLV